MFCCFIRDFFPVEGVGEGVFADEDPCVAGVRVEFKENGAAIRMFFRVGHLASAGNGRVTARFLSIGEREHR